MEMRPTTYKVDFSVSKNTNASAFNGRKEKEIWEAFRNGDRSAFVYIYQSFGDDLLNYGYQFLKDKSKLKDTIQDLFLYLYRNSKNLNSTDSIKFYLYRSLRRLIAKESAKKSFSPFSTKHPQGRFNVDLSQEAAIIQQEEKTWELFKLKKA